MTTDIDRVRASRGHPGRALAAAIWARAPEILWRALHPLSRDAFVDAPAPTPVTRLEYGAADGWRAPVFVVPRRPGASGEPVLLWPTLAASPHIFRYGRQKTLASQLTDAGFAVYLGTHRIGRDARGTSAPTFDEAARYDLAGATQAVRDHSGYPRVHVVGHGFGGQLALAWSALEEGRGLASMAVLSAPVCFPSVPPGLRKTVLAAVTRLPGGWRVPARRAARWVTPFVGPDVSDGERIRGALSHATDDVPLAVLEQFRSWFAAGALVDRAGSLDYRHGLSRVSAPMWLCVGDGDRWCPPAWALPAKDDWGGTVHVHRAPAEFDHLDLLMHPSAPRCVHGPLVAWLEKHRVRAWREDRP